MNEILTTVTVNVINTLAPILITALTSFIAVKFNGMVNLKKQELQGKIQNDILRQATDELFNKITINDQILDFANKKAIEGLHLAEEKALKTWKDSSVKEITGKDKKDIAVDYVTKSVETITQDKNILGLIPNIVEKTLVEHRDSLDEMFTNIKTNFIYKTGIVPENSRNPLDVAKPNVTP